jgi:hypothetical protein
VHRTGRLAFDRVVRADADDDVAASHALDLGGVFAAGTVEQRDGSSGLQPKHLHMTRSGGRQRELDPSGQREIAKETRRSGHQLRAFTGVRSWWHP